MVVEARNQYLHDLVYLTGKKSKGILGSIPWSLGYFINALHYGPIEARREVTVREEVLARGLVEQPTSSDRVRLGLIPSSRFC
jgi:hypothetical protein